jgi:menaquinone-specific isochorismate synthase
MLGMQELVKSSPVALESPTMLVSYSVPWASMPMLDFLRLGINAPRVYWETDKSNSSLRFAGFGVAAAITADGPARFDIVQQQVTQLFAHTFNFVHADVPPEAGPRLVGGFSFNPDGDSRGVWSAFPAARFILPRYQLTQSNGRSWLTLNRLVEGQTDGTAIRRELQKELQALPVSLSPANGHRADRLVQNRSVMDQQTWYRLVADATTRIRRGDLDKVVLARARQMRFEQPVEPVKVLERLGDRYPDTYRFLVEPIPGHAFYGATPELLASVEGSRLRTVAMAGSIRRGRSAAEDDRLAEELMNNPKERHEHALVVDAVRENLAPLVTDLQLPARPDLCRLGNIQHLETKIEGLLTNNYGILPVIKELHPTPAVGGRPRPIALDIINNVEPTPRGWYAAPVGWIDHQGNGMFSVAIRSAVSVGGDSMLFAGAGIVADSIPAREWRETELKFRPLAEALGGFFCNGRAKS